RHLRQLNCRHKMFDNISVPALNSHLPQVEYYLHNRKHLIIYDFTRLKGLNLELLNSVLQSVHAVFDYCKPCLPSYVLLDYSTEYLYSLASELFALKVFPLTFRVVLVGNLSRLHSAVMWRPLWDG